ncbi:hypothetical protein [Kocuria massiliensis]|uniref:hypothetical protein n=1 Tax=Kocuria massiliensis TaxID=1926282 RepID=UPI0022B9B6FC|nr:hypothetical protein [Kocuria massiliensis]
MANGEIGKVWVRVVPNTKSFVEDVKKTVSRVERQVKAEIPLAVKLDRAALAEVKKKLDSIKAVAKLGVETQLDQAKFLAEAEKAVKQVEGQLGKMKIGATFDDNGLISKAREAAKRAQAAVPAISMKTEMDNAYFQAALNRARAIAQSANLEIPATVQGEELRQQIANAVRVVEHTIQSIKIPVDAEEAAAFKAKVQRMVDYIEGRKASIHADADTEEAKHRLDEAAEDREATIDANADTGAARAKLMNLTRARFVEIIPKMNAAAFSATKTALMALGGGNVLGDYGKSLKNVFTDLDRVAKSAAQTGLAISSLGSMALAGTSNLFALGSSLASIFPATLALPGMFAGAAVGVTTMVLALKDAGTVLADLGPQFTALQESVSSSFWAQAAQPIRDMANSLLPQLTTQMSGTATAIGGLFAGLAGAIQNSLGGGMLASLFAPLNQSIGIAARGMQPLVTGLVNLGRIGGQYLPVLAAGFVDVANSFAQWSSTADISSAIDAGVQAFKDLWNVGVQTVGILAAIANAANQAGGSGLGELAAGLQNVNAALSGPLGQGAMITVFSGAHQAMANLGPAVTALGNAFVALAPTISSVMTTAASAVTVLVQGLAQALQNPVFTGGIQAMFQGILTGAQALQPAMGGLGTIFGTLASVVGAVAAQLGPVLGAAITAMAPVVQSLGAAIQAVVPVIGTFLVGAIQAVAPVIQAVAQGIANFAQSFPQISSVVLAVAAGITGFIAVLVQVITFIAPIVGAISQLISGFGGLSGIAAVVAPIFEAIASVLAGMSAPMLALVAAIAVFGGALAVALAQSEGFRNAVMGVFTAIGGLLAPILATVIPPLVMIGQAFMNLVTTITSALVPMITVIVQIFAQMIASLTPVVTFLMGILGPAFQFIATVVSTVFSVIGSIISAAIGVITAVLTTFLALLQGNWSGVWSGLGSIVSSVWNLIVTIVQGALSILGTIVSAGITMVVSIVSTIWNGLVGIVSGIWNGITSAIGSAVSGIGNAVSSGFNSTMNFIRSIMSAIGSFISSTWSSIVSAVAGFISGIVSKVSSGFQSMLSTVSGILSALGSAISSVWNSIVSAVTGAVGNVLSAVSSGFRSVVSAVVGAMASLGGAVSGGVQAVIGFFVDMGSRIMSTISDVAGKMVSVGSDMIRGLIDGIKQMAGQVVEAAKSVVDGAVKGAKALLGIHSPSRVFMEIGDYTGQGMVKGLEHKTASVQAAMSAMVQPVEPPRVSVPRVDFGAVSGGPLGETENGAPVVQEMHLHGLPGELPGLIESKLKYVMA